MRWTIFKIRSPLPPPGDVGVGNFPFLFYWGYGGL
jgi:hypothetical protein